MQYPPLSWTDYFAAAAILSILVTATSIRAVSLPVGITVSAIYIGLIVISFILRKYQGG